MNDPALQAMREAYLVPNNVRSLLDAAFMLNGRAYGMVCCEETVAARDWRAGEVMALRAMVTRLALLMSGAPESVLWTTPSLPAKALAGGAPPAPADRRASTRRGLAPIDGDVSAGARSAAMQTPPERLGKYLIRRELGRGAMGVVYEGDDPLIVARVAIKALRIEWSTPRLDAELGALSPRGAGRRPAQPPEHSLGLRVRRGGPASSGSFIAMELVGGRDLKGLLDTGPASARPPPAGSCRAAERTALRARARRRPPRHQAGNIILVADGRVKVADFGIAKLDASELTQLGSVLGTVSHMSPEQLTGDAVDRRSDLFSCGVILYQLLTGERALQRLAGDGDAQGAARAARGAVAASSPSLPPPARRGGSQGHGEDAGGALCQRGCIRRGAARGHRRGGRGCVDGEPIFCQAAVGRRRHGLAAAPSTPRRPR